MSQNDSHSLSFYHYYLFLLYSPPVFVFAKDFGVFPLLEVLFTRFSSFVIAVQSRLAWPARAVQLSIDKWKMCKYTGSSIDSDKPLTVSIRSYNAVGSQY